MEEEKVYTFSGEKGQSRIFIPIGMPRHDIDYLNGLLGIISKQLARDYERLNKIEILAGVLKMRAKIMNKVK